MYFPVLMLRFSPAHWWSANQWLLPTTCRPRLVNNIEKSERTGTTMYVCACVRVCARTCVCVCVRARVCELFMAENRYLESVENINPHLDCLHILLYNFGFSETSAERHQLFWVVGFFGIWQDSTVWACISINIVHFFSEGPSLIAHNGRQTQNGDIDRASRTRRALSLSMQGNFFLTNIESEDKTSRAQKRKPVQNIDYVYFTNNYSLLWQPRLAHGPPSFFKFRQDQHIIKSSRGCCFVCVIQAAAVEMMMMVRATSWIYIGDAPQMSQAWVSIRCHHNGTMAPVCIRHISGKVATRLVIVVYLLF